MPDQNEVQAEAVETTAPLADDRAEIAALEEELARVRAEREANLRSDAEAADKRRLDAEKERLRAELHYEKQANALLTQARGEDVPEEFRLQGAVESVAVEDATVAPAGEPATVTSGTATATTTAKTAEKNAAVSSGNFSSKPASDATKTGTEGE
jgi:hypothetical protein